MNVDMIYSGRSAKDLMVLATRRGWVGVDRLIVSGRKLWIYSKVSQCSGVPNSSL